MLNKQIDKLLNKLVTKKYCCAWLLVSLSISATAQSPSAFETSHTAIAAHITQYDTSHFNKVINRKKISFFKEDVTVEMNGASWEVQKKITPVAGKINCFDVQLFFHCTAGSLSNASLSLDIDIVKWAKGNYVLLPAAVYNGNRVNAVKQPYLSFWADARDIGIDKPQLVSDIPRLNINEGPSAFQQRSGDMSTPAVGYFNPAEKKCFWMLMGQGNSRGDYGIDMEENNSRTKASITITSPVLRELHSYFIADNAAPTNDNPANFVAGDTLTIAARIYFFDAARVQDLYNVFPAIKTDILHEKPSPPAVPFSTAYSMLQEKFNRQNFEPNFGYYSVGLRENCFQDWQIGWTGGLISTYPLLTNGTDNTVKNVIKNFDWLFTGGISPSGFFWDTGEKGDKWLGIFPGTSVGKDLHLIRKSGDGLFYAFKQFDAFKQKNISIKPSWQKGTKTVADAFVKTWKKYGQLGQYVNNTSGELIIGGSTSGGIVPGALMLASAYFNEPVYAMAAKEIAQDYFDKYVSKGLIYGGAGDAMQNFDSESCYGLLESYMVLYEQTGEKKWLNMAEDVAMQFATWVSSFDFVFPPKSTLAKLGKQTTGVVWANTQNKHGAPGICTHSGVALLRLYRATGNAYFLHLLQLIANAIPQYMATKENPIAGLQTSWISERVSTTDWLEGIGEIYPGSTWSETAMMLTATELPGIYVDADKQRVVCFDQVKATILKTTKNNMLLEIFNPTIYNCTVTILTDNKSTLQLPMLPVYKAALNTVSLKPFEKRKIYLTIK